MVKHVLENVIKGMSIISQWVLLAIELSIVYEVVVRYLLNSPTSWAEEISEYMLVFLAFVGAAEVQRQKQHIKMNFFYKKYSQRVRKFLDIVFGLIILVFSALIFWNSLNMTLTAAHYNARSNTLLAVPLFIPYAVVPIGMGLLTLQSLIDIINSFRNFITMRAEA